MARTKRHNGDTESFTTIIKKSVKDRLVNDYRNYKYFANDSIEFYVEVILPHIPVDLMLRYKNEGDSAEPNRYFAELARVFSDFSGDADYGDYNKGEKIAVIDGSMKEAETEEKDKTADAEVKEAGIITDALEAAEIETYTNKEDSFSMAMEAMYKEDEGSLTF